MSIQSRADTDYGPKHEQELEYFNRLILDLKLQVTGRPEMMRQPITIERLNEADKHLQELQQCRERKVFR